MLTNPMTGQEVTNADLKEIVDLAKRQISLQQVIEQTEIALNTLREQLKNISEISIPEKMMELGMTEFKLDTGEKVSVSKYYSGSICAESAYDWLRDNDHGDLIKNEVKLSFGKGEDDLAIEVTKKLLEQGLSPEQKTYVHPQTLKSFVKEQLEGGNILPTDSFTVYVGNKTKITPVKTKK